MDSMPPRPRGKMHRGGRGGHWERDHGGGGGRGGGYRGRGHWERDHGGGGGRGGGYRGRGRGGGHRGGRSDYYHGKRGSRSPPPRQRHDPEKILAGLGPEAQLALTTAIINSVLKSDGREGRGNYHHRDRPHHRDARRDGRGGGYFREESRERRHYGDERRAHDPRPTYHEEGRGHHYEREKSTSGSPRYRNNRYSGMPRRRPSPHGHPGPSRKRQRVEKLDVGEGESPPHIDHDFDEEDSYDQERPRERRHRSTSGEEQHKGQEGDGTDGGDDKEEGSDGRSGMQVTIRADGERAVNSEGHVRSRVSSRPFVELRCPHCPSQKSVTFKEYKFHLGSDGHMSQLNRLAKKHSVVLRKIRIQQRQEQRDIEEKWKEEKPDEFKSAVSKFCTTCKLAFKCLGNNVSDGISHHNRSKLHRMQRHYLHPRCGICHITFPSRMVYEYHIASINHFRVRSVMTYNNGGEGRSDEQDQEDDDDVLDLANFMTVDSVGEDDEDVGSEHEEITEGLEAVEAAEEASIKRSSKATKRRHSGEDDELSVDADWDKDLGEEEDDEGGEAVGTEYVTRIEAYYCSLCCKVIRGDTSLGSRCVRRHCRSFDHLAHYQDAHPPAAVEEQCLDSVKSRAEGDSPDADNSEQVEDEADEEEDGDYVGESDGEEYEDQVEDPEQEKLWEEVDQGLTALQGEIMNEIDGRSSPTTKKGKEAEEDDHMEDADAEVGEESADEEEGKMEIAEREDSFNESANEGGYVADENKEPEDGEDNEATAEDQNTTEMEQKEEEEELGSSSEGE